jgi:hypothetical protein
MSFNTRAIAAGFGAAILAGCASQHGFQALPSAGLSPAGASQTRLGTDVGRRAGDKPVHVVILLRYNHEDELRSDRRLEGGASEFAQRYAPTAVQESSVVRALRDAGFTIERTYANHTIVDAVAASSTVERYFSTRIDDFAQNGFENAAANVRPLKIPAALSSLVRVADADERVGLQSTVKVMQRPGASKLPLADAVVNGTFETGLLSPWQSCRSGPNAQASALSSLHPHSGKYDGFSGTSEPKQGETDGRSALCQTVTIPPSGRLSLGT